MGKIKKCITKFSILCFIIIFSMLYNQNYTIAAFEKDTSSYNNFIKEYTNKNLDNFEGAGALNLAAAYFLRAYNEYQVNNNPSAILYYKNALYYLDKIDTNKLSTKDYNIVQSLYALTYVALGRLYSPEQDIETPLFYLTKVEKYAQYLDDGLVFPSLMRIAYLYLLKGEKDKSLDYALKAKTLCQISNSSALSDCKNALDDYINLLKKWR